MAGNELDKEDGIQPPPSLAIRKKAPILKRLKPKNLQYQRLAGFELVRYDGEEVFVECKIAGGALWKSLSDRVQGLALLLKTRYRIRFTVDRAAEYFSAGGPILTPTRVRF